MSSRNTSDEVINSQEREYQLLNDINNKLHNMMEILSIKEKIIEKVIDDHEKRLRFNEKAIWGGFGALGFLQIVLKFWGG